MKKYTVVGFYEDNEQTFVEHVEAEDVENAISITSKASFACIAVVEVFEGHLYGAWGPAKVQYRNEATDEEVAPQEAEYTGPERREPESDRRTPFYPGKYQRALMERGGERRGRKSAIKILASRIIEETP